MGYKKQVFRSLAMVTQLGISVMTPMFLCLFAGYFIDLYLGTKLIVFFLIIGVVSGGQCGYRMAKMTFLAGEKEERRELEEQQKKRSQNNDVPAVSRPKSPSRVKEASRQAAAAENGSSGMAEDSGHGDGGSK